MNRMPWSDDGRVFGETILFFGETDERRPAFGLKKLHRLFQPQLGELYEEGRDYAVDRRRGIIRRLAGSRMPYLTREERYPVREQAILFPAPHANAIDNAHGSPTGFVRFSDKDFFLRKDVAVDYTASRTLPTVPTVPGKLPRFAAKVRAGEQVKIAFVGDSITAGRNASATVGVPPNLAPYTGRVADWLDERTPCVCCNCAVSGTCSLKGPGQFAEVLKHQTPDLLFVAFGMNELKIAPAEFRKRLEAILALGREANPDMEFVLVSSMQKTTEWLATPPGAEHAFEREMAKIAAKTPAVALAPVNTLWRAVEKRKTFLELTGNGVNHPNDFGYALYTYAVVKVLEAAIGL